MPLMHTYRQGSLIHGNDLIKATAPVTHNFARFRAVKRQAKHLPILETLSVELLIA